MLRLAAGRAPLSEGLALLELPAVGATVETLGADSEERARFEEEERARMEREEEEREEEREEKRGAGWQWSATATAS